jgi:hypothetical protein
MAPVHQSERALAQQFALVRFGPTGFRCLRCSHAHAYWVSPRRPRMQECRRCHKQQSVTSGTPLHATKLPLRIWFDRAARVDACDLPTSTSFALDHGISRSSAWHLTQRLFAAVAEQADIPDDSLVCWLMYAEVRCRRPKPTPPLAPDAPPELRRRRDDFRVRRRGLRCDLAVRIAPHRVVLHDVCLTHEQRAHVKRRRRLLEAYHPGIPRWLRGHLEVHFRTVSIRWLARYLGHLLLLWNRTSGRHQPRQPEPTLERLAFAVHQPLHRLRPWA